MKTYILLILSIFTICPTLAKEGSRRMIQSIHAKPAYFAVHITGIETISEDLKIVFWRNDLLDSVHLFGKNADDKNSFYFELSPFEFPSRIQLYLKRLNPSMILDWQLVLPGDSVHVWINTSSTNSYQLSFTGRGVEKYKCSNALAPLRREVNDLWRKVQSWSNTNEGDANPELISNEMGLLMAKYSRVLDTYRAKLDRNTYNILQADLKGYAKHQQLKITATAYAEAAKTKKVLFETSLKELLFSESEITDPIVLAQSSEYREYIYEKHKIELLLQRSKNFTIFDMGSTASISCGELYNILKYGYKGTLREKLLAQLFIYSRDLSNFFRKIDEDALAYYLEDAVELIQTPFLKHKLFAKLANNTKGKRAYDFALPNLRGDTVRLSDFKGKVVFIDVWGYPCGGCLSFKRKFETEVYPMIKDNPDFVVISINLSDEKSVWLKALDQYSDPRFINLAAGLGNRNHFDNHYNIGAIPFLILIDRQGKIVTTNLRDTDELLSLIKQTLAR